jgi:TonB family protein
MLSRKLSYHLAVCSLLILAGAALAQSPPQASEIVNKVSSAYQNLRSFHFEAQSISEEQRDGMITRSESTRIFASDGQGRIRIEYKNPSLEFLNLFDGGARWTYFPMSRQYSRKVPKNPKNPNNLYDGPLVDGMITTDVVFNIHTRYAEPESDAELIPPLKAIHGRPMETIKVGDRKISAYVVEIEYAFVPTEGRELRRTLWIDQQRFIVLRDLAVRKETRSGKTTEYRTLVNLTVAKVNEKLPGDLFIFNPPPDALAVEFPSSPIKDFSDFVLHAKAMYGEPHTARKNGAIPAGIPGGVGPSHSQETAPSKPEQLNASGVEPGNPIKQTQPDYPLFLQAARISGVVRVRITVDEKGNVIDAMMISGHPLLEDVSLKAARKWKFTPTLSNGAPVSVQGVLTFTFTLPNKQH